ncbi:MAG: hypothetical protein OSA83_06815 [Pseudomonadales bacterium]|jgi:transglutaminase-like putative cysteine protease|nr:hypothetical protein [Pseudomonadales bacterium]
MKLSAMLFLFSLAGCANLAEPPDALLLAELRGVEDQADFAQPINILELSEEMKTFADSHVESRWRTDRKLEELRNLLFSPDLFDIEYESGITKTAIETYESGAGNCLSMTNMFIALARYVGLDANYHLVKLRPE